MLSSGLRAWGPPCLTAHFLVLFLSIQNSTQKFRFFLFSKVSPVEVESSLLSRSTPGEVDLHP